MGGTKMRKFLGLLLCVGLTFSCFACGTPDAGKADSDAADTAAVSDGAAEETAASNVAGEYAYNETNAYGLDIAWTLVLDEDGNYALTEENTVAGVATYTGTYTVDGETIVCGPMNEDGPGVYDWADPAGYSVTLDGAGFTPVM